MNTSVQVITIPGLIWALLPVVIVIGILYRWTNTGRTAVYAVARMLIQLLLIGFVLVFIFDAEQPGIIILVLAVMLVVASWIAIRPLQDKQPYLFRNALIAIVISGALTLALVTQVVLGIEPWFLPRYMVPLAGMIFANSMNAVSLAAERFEAERDREVGYAEARSAALQASLIPIINTLFAVGLVSLPGMMTGQILSGVSPFIAARYQIVVMCMIFGSAGMSSAIYLALAKKTK
ncbi:MAG: ABC transporter permease [Gammaproteobacteria bacterium]|nr:MAG: ABC transporter permease [Gammaproteobacteria bacterium]